MELHVSLGRLIYGYKQARKGMYRQDVFLYWASLSSQSLILVVVVHSPDHKYSYCVWNADIPESLAWSFDEVEQSRKACHESQNGLQKLSKQDSLVVK